ncbi:MAG TPA: hypothetical protein VF746_26400 [Longimicrobium sp.]|jgi:hypothetical protein
MLTSTPGTRLALVGALLAACAPGGTESAGTLPPVAGAHPRMETLGARDGETLARRSPGWRPASDYAASLRVDAGAAGFFAGLPATGTQVPMRAVSWPAPVRLVDSGDGAATLRGDTVAAAALAGDVRCGGGADAGVPVHLVAEVLDRPAGLTVEVRYGGPEPLDCELSSLGGRRLQSAAADVYLWARSVARAGTELPAAYP